METPPRTNTTTSASPYRLGNWTITQLKEELKQRNLSPAGKKQELIERLERYEHDAALATPRHGRRSAADRYKTFTQSLKIDMFIIDRLARAVLEASHASE